MASSALDIEKWLRQSPDELVMLRQRVAEVEKYVLQHGTRAQPLVKWQLLRERRHGDPQCDQEIGRAHV